MSESWQCGSCGKHYKLCKCRPGVGQQPERYVIMKGRSVGMTCITSEDIHRLGIGPPRPIQICDFCGCLHRSGVRVCESCFEAAQCVRMQRLEDALATPGTARRMSGAYHPRGLRDSGGYEIIIVADQAEALRTSLERLQPTFASFTDAFARAVANAWGLTVDDLLRPIPLEEPVMKRNRKNRGPQQHRKWWLNR